MQQAVIKMKFGSHVYGCNTPTSDTDYKGVFIPPMRDVLLGKQPKTSVVKSTGQSHTKNTNEDVDDEMFTLQGFLRMVAEGQVVALDDFVCMLYAAYVAIEANRGAFNEGRKYFTYAPLSIPNHSSH